MESNDQYFKEELTYLVESYGSGSDDGIKEALRTCQDIFDSVSERQQVLISEAFGVEKRKIETLIKFMPSIKVSGEKYEVICCVGPRCAKKGSYEVIKSVKESLGIDFNEVTEDGKIRLRSQNCFRKCQQGPNIQVNGEFHHRMTAEKAERLMEELKR